MRGKRARAIRKEHNVKHVRLADAREPVIPVRSEGMPKYKIPQGKQ